MTRPLALSIVFAVAACGSSTPQTPPTPAGPGNTAPADTPEIAAWGADVERRRFVGSEIGIEIRHLSGPPNARQTLPSGLESLRAINVADGYHWTVARDGEDLVVLLIDERGVVIDDATMPGRGHHTVIVGDCPNAFVGIAPPDACEGADDAEIDIGWTRDDHALEQGGAETCSCDIVNLDVPAE